MPHSALQIDRQSSSHSTLDDLWRGPLPSRSTRNIPRKSSASARGFVLGCDGRRIVQFESGMERGFASVMLARQDVVDLREQPEPVHYVDAEGYDCIKQFDYFATMRCGTRIAIEVKPKDKVDKHGWREEIALIAAQAGGFADAYALVTEKKLARSLVANANLIRCCRRDRNADHDAMLRKTVAGLHGRVTVGTLVKLSGLEGDGFRAVVRLIDEGVLTVVGDGRIDYPTLVKRAAPAGARVVQ